MRRLRKVFGERIRNLRLARGLTQEELAEKAGLHPTYIGIIERGEQSATLDTVEKLAKALEVEVEDLFPKKPFRGEKGKLLLEIEDTLKSQSVHDIRKIYHVCSVLLEKPPYAFMVAERKKKPEKK